MKLAAEVSIHVWVPSLYPANIPLYARAPFLNHTAKFCLIVISDFFLEVYAVKIMHPRSISLTVFNFSIMTLD